VTDSDITSAAGTGTADDRSTTTAIEQATRFLTDRLPVDVTRPAICVVLGSGLGHVGDVLVRKGAIPIDFADIPGFQISSVSGHQGRLLFQPDDRNVFVMQGRVHYYEGHEIDAIEFPIRTLRRLGVQQLILTNAAGGVNESLIPGDLMMITDHLCFIPAQPPPAGSGSADSLARPIQIGIRSVYRSVYCQQMQSQTQATADRLGIPLKRGVYAAMSGPNYETPAEVRMLRSMGADAVGMSTVLEAMAAIEIGIRVLGISCITNSAAGITGEPLCHSEVQQVAGQVEESFAELILTLIAP
jgi:purine-nucleoside phosphorylase